MITTSRSEGDAGTPEVPATAEGPGTPEVPGTYRAHLDGLRAFAVYLVVAFHAGSGRFAGGFVGVDVFFVLSGYLVTQLLVRDIQGHGRIRFGRFYARRFRRLLPAAFLALIGTAAVYTLLMTPVETLRAVDAFKASFLYSANWYFIRQSADYFGDQVLSNPVLHFWSLAVEEQFYVLWPLLLAGIVWIGARISSRRPWVAVRVIVAAGALTSLAWAMLLRNESPGRAYYGTDTRAYQLLFGALLALTPGLFRLAARLGRLRPVIAAAASIALVGLATSAIDTGPIVRGAAVTVFTLALLLSLEGGGGGLVDRVLSLRPIVYLGKISYGTYLWHWPVIVVLLSLTDVSPLAMMVLASLVGTALAALSAQLVELPIRESRPLNRVAGVVIVAGLTISIVSGLVVIPRIMRPERAATAKALDVANPGDLGLTPVPADFDQVKVDAAHYGTYHQCSNAPVRLCTLHVGKGKRVLLIGDSNAAMLTKPLLAVAKAHDLTFAASSIGGCPWQRHYYSLDPERRKRCEGPKEDLYRRVIPALKPDLVVVINTLDMSRGQTLEFGGTDRDKEERRVTQESAAELTKGGRDLLIVEPFARPGPEVRPLDCLAKATYVEQCRYRVSVQPNWIEVVERDIAAKNPHVRTVDFDRVACPLLPVCDVMIDDTAVWWDAVHLTDAYEDRLVEPLTTYLEATGFLPPR